MPKTPLLRPRKSKERSKSESQVTPAKELDKQAPASTEKTSKHNCQTCQDSFKNQALLKQHESLHKQQGKNECEVCFKLFKSRNEMKLHERSHQSGKKNWCVSPFKRPKGTIPASKAMQKACAEFKVAYQEYFNET